MNRSRKYAKLLMLKAAQDEFVITKLVPDKASPDEVIGFHAQQAVEKMLKAVLSHRSIAYRRTHDLAELIDSVKRAGIHLTADIEEARRLSPFAVEFRYDQLPPEKEPSFNRRWAEKELSSGRNTGT